MKWVIRYYQKVRQKLADYRKWPRQERIVFWIGAAILGYLLLCQLAVTFLGWKWTPAGIGDKTVWDWLELLVIPAVLAGGAYYFNRQERESEKQIANDRQQEAALQTYYDRMTELLLEKGLRTSEEDDEVRAVARSRTLATLRTLDGKRKGMLVQFLVEAGLVNERRVINLEGADLSKLHLPALTNLRHSNLQGAYIAEAKLGRINLEGANLSETYLTQVATQGSQRNRPGRTERL